MSNSQLSCFVYRARPQLRQSGVSDIPVSDLGPDLTAELLASLQVSPLDGATCASIARLWEEALEAHRVPYLLLRVADMRMVLGSKITALSLYEELQLTLQDPVFADWLVRTRRDIINEIRKQLLSFKHDRSQGFSPSQRWRSTALVDNSSPYCRMLKAPMEEIRSLWWAVASSEDAMDRAINLHCLETNAIESMVTVVPSAYTELVYSGFDQPSVPISNLVAYNSTVRDSYTAIGILQDARKAFDAAMALLKTDSVALTPELVCYLHRLLMRHNRVLQIDTGREERVTYTNIGQTRQASCTNVAATLRIQHVKIQFCPHDEVDAELDVFCKRYNSLLQQTDICPFAAAAWISHVFITIHPFEDGNGRLSRILASIPLMKKGLPPLCIPSSYKDAYSVTLNNIRANRDGDFTILMKHLYSGTKASLERLQAISAVAASKF